MKITQMMVKFIYYVKHSSLQKGVFRHKIVKTLRKGINHPPLASKRQKDVCFTLLFLSALQTTESGENRQDRYPKRQIALFDNNGKFLSFTITATADTLPNVRVAP